MQQIGVAKAFWQFGRRCAPAAQVDVLRRQKLHLEAAALLDISSVELMKAMDLGGAAHK